MQCGLTPTYINLQHISLYFNIRTRCGLTPPNINLQHISLYFNVRTRCSLTPTNINLREIMEYMDAVWLSNWKSLPEGQQPMEVQNQLGESSSTIAYSPVSVSVVCGHVILANQSCGWISPQPIRARLWFASANQRPECVSVLRLIH